MSYPYQRKKMIKICCFIVSILLVFVMFSAFSFSTAKPSVPSNFEKVQYVNWNRLECFYFKSDSLVYFLSGQRSNDEENKKVYWKLEEAFTFVLDGYEATLTSSDQAVTSLSFIKDYIFTSQKMYQYNGVIDLSI